MSGEQLHLGDDERTVALRRAWDRSLHLLAARVSKVTFESYIKPIRPLGLDRQEVTLGVASPFAREWLDKRYTALIASTLESVLGFAVEIRFNVLAPEERARLDCHYSLEVPPNPSPSPAVETHEAASPPSSVSRAARSAPKRAGAEVSQSLPLNERYTFDSFVVGKSNRLAQAAALAIAAAPGSVYNPLFLYGGPGLGKTHLLHAIGHAVRATSVRSRVTYVDGENFTYHYVTALRERKTEEFRRHYRGVDVWLVDDIQFLAGATQTKEEFFHTFNALYQTGRQIVISSDRSPRELRAMDDRLRSRFECGLIADITAPELETRMAILCHRCAAESWDVPREVVYYIASAIRSNIRALEGALTKLVAYSSIMNAPISIDIAQSVLGEYLIERPLPGQVRKGIPMETILTAVAEHYQTTIEAIRGQRRDKAVVTARQTAMFLCREVTGTCLAQIGAAIGGRDHTTVQRGVAKVESLLQSDPSLQDHLQQIRAKLER